MICDSGHLQTSADVERAQGLNGKVRVGVTYRRIGPVATGGPNSGIPQRKSQLVGVHPHWQMPSRPTIIAASLPQMTTEAIQPLATRHHVPPRKLHARMNRSRMQTHHATIETTECDIRRAISGGRLRRCRKFQVDV